MLADIIFIDSSMTFGKRAICREARLAELRRALYFSDSEIVDYAPIFLQAASTFTYPLAHEASRSSSHQRT